MVEENRISGKNESIYFYQCCDYAHKKQWRERERILFQNPPQKLLLSTRFIMKFMHLDHITCPIWDVIFEIQLKFHAKHFLVLKFQWKWNIGNRASSQKVVRFYGISALSNNMNLTMEEICTNHWKCRKKQASHGLDTNLCEKWFLSWNS